MKKYKQELKRRIFILEISGVIAILALILMVVIGILCTHSEEFMFPSGKVVPFFVGFELTIGMRVQKYKKILKDQAKIEESHISELDERNRLVEYKTADLCLKVFMLLLALGGIVSAYISDLMFYTFGGTLIAVLITYCIIKIYYERKI